MMSFCKVISRLMIVMCLLLIACSPTSPNNSGAEAPLLISPTNNTILKNNRPQFDWADVERVGNYELFVSDTSGIAIIQQNNLTVSYFNTTTVLSDQKYYWKVRSRDGLGNWGDWSKRWSFTVDTHGPITPTLSSPLNGTTINDNTPLIDWNDVAGAYKYELNISNGSMTVVLDSSLTKSSYAVTSVLPDGEYSWRVRCRDGVGNWSGWSSTWSFIVGTIPVISVSDTQLNFGTVSIGNSRNVVFNISNTGYVSLSITGITSSNPLFAVVGGTTYNIPARSNQAVTVRFSPTSAGNQSGILQIANNSSENPKNVNLNGAGTEPSNIEGLIAYFPFQGNCQDEKGNYDGIAVNAVFADDRGGNPQSSISFNGDAYVNLGDVFNDLNPPFSISAWINCTGENLKENIFGTDIPLDAASQLGGYLFALNRMDGNGSTLLPNHKLIVECFINGGIGYNNRRTRQSSIDCPMNQWVHVVGIFNGLSEMEIYINGQNVGDKYSGGANGFSHNNSPALIGSVFHGLIDEMRIFNKSLSEEEIRSLQD